MLGVHLGTTHDLSWDRDPSIRRYGLHVTAAFTAFKQSFALARRRDAQAHNGSMRIGHHWLGRYKDFFRELGKRPTAPERRARTSERHRLLVPTRIAVWVAIALIAYFLVWPMLRGAFAS